MQSEHRTKAAGCHARPVPKPRVLLRRVLLCAALLVLVILVWAGSVLLLVRGDVDQAQAELEAARGAHGATAVRTDLRAAEQTLRRVQARLDQPGPVLAGYLPLLGRTPTAVRRSVDATLAVTTGARGVLDAATGEGKLVVDGRIDPVRLRRVTAALREAATRSRGPVSLLRTTSTTFVPVNVLHGVRKTQRTLDGVPARLADAGDALDAVGSLTGADGPRHLLIVLENNAELRGTGGLVSVFAEATATDGKLTLERFRDVEQVADAVGAAKTVPAPEDYATLWGPFRANSTLWKNVNMSPDVPQSSAVLAEIAAKGLGRRPDAIVWLDVRALAAVLGATSPATLPDGAVLSADNAVTALLSDAYAEAADDKRSQGLRRARLRAAADAVVERLVKGTPDVVRLGPALGQTASERHLAVWSARPAEQRLWESSGVSGRVGGLRPHQDVVSVVVNNFGGGDRDGNKLDYYARRTVAVTAVVQGDIALVQQDVELRNDAPARGLPVYVAGGGTPGVTNNYVSLAMPAEAQLLEFSRAGKRIGARPVREDDHQVVSDGISLPPGTRAHWVLRYRLPIKAGHYALRVVPQPLAYDAQLRLDIRAADGRSLLRDGGSDGKLDRGALVVDAPLTSVLEVAATARRPGLLRRTVDAVKTFWTQPVSF